MKTHMHHHHGPATSQCGLDFQKRSGVMVYLIEDLTCRNCLKAIISKARKALKGVCRGR